MVGEKQTISGNELLKRFLQSSIENSVDEAHVDELIKVFTGILVFYRCLQGHPTPYHDITEFIYNYKYEIRIDDLEILMGAIELKLTEISIDQVKCFRKFRRHISLAVTQKYYIQKVANNAFLAAKNAQEMANNAQEMANKAQNISGRINETVEKAERVANNAEKLASTTKQMANEASEQIKESKKTSETMMINYVTILGIFATIIITVFGGINIVGSTVKLLEGNSKLGYLVFVISFLMICLLVLIRSLTSWINSLNSFKEDKVMERSPKELFRSSITYFFIIAVLAGVCSIFFTKESAKTDSKVEPNNLLFFNIDNKKES
jgi:ABC-type multidrug transport system fused ATPase/permease subunit